MSVPRPRETVELAVHVPSKHPSMAPECWFTMKFNSFKDPIPLFTILWRAGPLHHKITYAAWPAHDGDPIKTRQWVQATGLAITTGDSDQDSRVTRKCSF